MKRAPEVGEPLSASTPSAADQPLGAASLSLDARSASPFSVREATSARLHLAFANPIAIRSCQHTRVSPVREEARLLTLLEAHTGEKDPAEHSSPSRGQGARAEAGPHH